MNSATLHPAQIIILNLLRHVPSARYSELQKPSGLESENFKFHLRKLTNQGCVTKNTDGSYQLTAAGKEFANNLDRHARTVQKQPKLSVVVVVRALSPDGQQRYLMQERRRMPFWGYWGLISGPIRWGMSPEATLLLDNMRSIIQRLYFGSSELLS